MAPKKVNKAARRAASDGRITQKEAARIQSISQKVSSSPSKAQNNAVVAIAKAAANNQARIAQSVQQSFGFDQNKNLTQVNYTPPSSSTYIKGQRVSSGGQPLPAGAAPITAIGKNDVPTYTFTSKKKNGVTAKTTNPDGTTTENNSVTDQDPMNPMTDQWGDSVDSGLGELEAILAAQMEANAQQTSLYMGMMQDMMMQMQQAQQTAPQGAYATTTYQVDPAGGAKQTQEIVARKPITNESLSIAQVPTQAAGVGLNLAI